MLNIVTLGDERLQKHSIVVPEFNGEIQTLTEQMFETMYAKKGIGLAAVQVGKLIRLFITHIPNDGPRVFINPEVVETSVEQGTYEEGCLSVPEINADVIRPAHVRVQAWNLKGRPFSFDADQLLARVIQHELDHLNGVLFIDRLNPKKRERLVRRYEKPSIS
jgi:peptide deformylase